MGSGPRPDMSLVRVYRASLWMDEDSLRAVATPARQAGHGGQERLIGLTLKSRHVQHGGHGGGEKGALQ